MAGGRRVVVTGLGMATSLGLDVSENWRCALEGISGVSRLSLPDAEKSPVQAVGQIKEGDWQRIRETFGDEAQREGERRTLFALWAAKSALEDAALKSDFGNRQRFGAALAAGLGVNCIEDVHRWLDARGQFDTVRFGAECDKTNRESIIRNNSNRAAAVLSRRFELHGPNFTVTTACASATQALGIAFRAIRRGDADIMAAGGADSMINPVGLIFFVLLGAAATSPALEPHQACRPFDRKRSGLVMGEGAGIAILEEESHARARGARIYAEVAGYGSSIDAYRLTAPHPEGRGAEQSMGAALRDSGLVPDQIDYINAHGTSTKLNDIAETIAIKRLFGEHARSIAISSTKSIIGHLLAASGGPEFAFTVLSTHHDEVHPTLNLTHRDPKCDLDYVPQTKRNMTVRAALSNSFGFGGQNASIVVKKYRGKA